jgi:hypothetical protein
MSDLIELSLVRCATTDDKRSELVSTTLDRKVLNERLISESQQELAANEAKGLHLAAENEEHGLVTYLQQVTEGGFFVYVGDPSNLEEHWFGEGSWVAFNDHQGTGHASKVGPEGCKRTFRLLRGNLP